MRLTEDEYRRGIISWHIAEPAVIRLRAPSEDGAPSEWHASLTEQNGFVVAPIPLTPGIEIAVISGDSLPVDRPFYVRWQTVIGEEEVTAIWDAIHAPPTLIPRLPDLGTFHRVKIATPYLTWEEEARIWQDGTSLTFEHVEEAGQILMPVEPAAPGELPQQLTAVPSTIRRGTFEILTSGPTPPTAAAQASALVGFLAFVMGNEALGPVLHREDYEATPDETSVTISTMEPTTYDHMIRPILNVASDIFDLIAAYLPIVLGVGRSPQRADALRVALSAYERAGRSRSVLERFLACFIGVEGITTAYADEHGLRGLFADLQDDPRFSELLTSLQVEYKARDLRRLRENLGRPSNPERFGHYAKAHGLGKETRRSFHRLNDLRNKIAHGSSVQVGLEDAGAAKELLDEVLKAELGLPSPLPWEGTLQLGGMWASGTIPGPVAQEWLSAIHLRNPKKIDH